MNYPIVLRNSAEPDVVIGIALKIYYKINDWVSNATFLDQLDLEYDAAGRERETRSGGQMVAKYKPSLYYGLIDCRPEDDCKRINEYGKIFYEAYLNNDQDAMVDCLVHAIAQKQFGRNNPAVSRSDSEIEPPKVFLVSSLLLKGLNKNEYAYIIEQLSNGKTYQMVLVDVMLSRQLGKTLDLSEYAKNNYRDDKGIKFLTDAGFFDDSNGLRTIKPHYVLKYQEILKNLAIINTEVSDGIVYNEPEHFCKPIQQIIYGAPGTGKSFEICKITEQIDELTEANSEEPRVFRTTFHPDSDYSTFVGAYKPEKTKHPVRNVAGNVVFEDGKEVQEDIITYNFCPQAFAKAYIRAWQTKEPVILVIEEINRGNCAQIFGDLFQLLDRDGNNESKYPIDPDTDFGKFIAEKLEGFNVPELIKQGKKLKLPANFYIWATMNTSDQSLFPIDSAFKRRWDWRYIKIAQPKKDGTDEKFNWKIEGDIDWWQFVKKINDIILRMTNSADKQLGYFFAKANNEDVITYDCFVSKVCFYLWNDIFKTYAVDGMENSLFKYTYIDEDDSTEKTGVLDFIKFFDEEGKVVPAIVEQFIQNVMNWQSEAK